MQRKFIAGLVVFVAGFICAFLLMNYYNSWAESRTEQSDTLPESDIRPYTNVSENAPVPSITIETFVDSIDGYNLNLKTENFTFTPGLVGELHSPNTGYAAIYVNGSRVARVYNPWYHMSVAELSPGQNTIEVILSTSDHTDWAVAGESIFDSVILDGTR